LIFDFSFFKYNYFIGGKKWSNTMLLWNVQNILYWKMGIEIIKILQHGQMRGQIFHQLLVIYKLNWNI